MKTNVVMCIALAIALTGCSGPSVRSQQNTYSYLGKVIEKADDVDLSPPQPHPLSRDYYQSMYGRPGAAVFDVLESTKSSPKTKYQRYTVLLEQGEKISLRSKIENIVVGDCARIWIIGPGVSPVYLYAPDQAEIDKAQGCTR